MNDHTPQIGFIVHGRPSRARRFQKELDKNRDLLDVMSCEVVFTLPGNTRDTARHMAENRLSHIIAVGGDGTLNEVVNGIMESGNNEVIMGHLSSGTANDWSKTWSHPGDLPSLLRAVQSAAWQWTDTGYIIFQDQRRKFFLNIADVGIGGEVISKVDRMPKWPGPNLVFFIAILRTFLSFKNIPLTCRTDNWEWEGKAKAAVCANGRYFGSGLAIAPEAVPDDGLLDLVLLGDVSLFDYIRYLPALKKGHKINDDRVIYRKIKRIHLEIPGKTGVEADGELMGTGAVTIGVKPRSLRFLPPFK